jgi:CHAT domain-containing protein
VTRLEALRDQARREHESFRAAAFAAQPAIRDRRGEVAPVAIADLRAEIEAGTLVLEYALTERGAFVFTLDRERGVRAHALGLSRRALEQRTADFRERLAQRDLDLARAARGLCRDLLGPARRDLARHARLLVIPDGALWELPFQALSCTPGRYLLEERALAYAPSLHALREMSRRAERRATGGTLLALGNPALGGAPVPRGARASRRSSGLLPLPEAEDEVRALARLYGHESSVYVGTEAGEARVKSEAAQHSVLHFAAHGLLDDARPLYSQLVLAPPRAGESEDGRLEAWEIMELGLRADLAVLSACETGRGRVGRGEGLIGLSWAFFVAGCPSTAVSQWKVDARSTSRLMIDFHRGLAAGRPKADALRDAALRLKRDPAFRHPFYWAAFIIVGADTPLPRR